MDSLFWALVSPPVKGLKETNLPLSRGLVTKLGIAPITSGDSWEGLAPSRPQRQRCIEAETCNLGCRSKTPAGSVAGQRLSGCKQASCVCVPRAESKAYFAALLQRIRSTMPGLWPLHLLRHWESQHSGPGQFVSIISQLGFPRGKECPRCKCPAQPFACWPRG